MRKIMLLMHVSLDGFVAGPNGEMDWISIGDELWDYVDTATDSADVALFGGTTYKMMEGYWPNAATQPDASAHDIKHSQWINPVQKIVFSKTLTPNKLLWKDTKIVSDHIAEEMTKMKTQPGKNMLMLGSASVAQAFMNLGLMDELWLNVNPIILGAGKPLFKDIKQRMNLRLISEKTLASGVVALKYEVVK